MPAVVNKTLLVPANSVFSEGISGAEGIILCSLFLKKSRYFSISSLAVMRPNYMEKLNQMQS
jgi:hypothetical protein